MNTINLPLALFTVVLRRFVDKLRVRQTAVVLKNSPWFLDTSLFKLCFYAYMFSTGLYYTLKHMRKGTIVSLAQKCSDEAISIKDRCMRKKWLERDKKPWLVRNLTKNRESQQKALGYVSSLLPQDMTNSYSHPLITNDNSDNNPPINCSSFNNPQQNSFATNPYFQPKMCFNRPIFNRIAASPRFSNAMASGNRKIPCIDITGESSECIIQTPARRIKRRNRVLPNYLSLRNRKIHKNELSGKVVRKTRSGKVYGYHGTKSRCKK